MTTPDRPERAGCWTGYRVRIEVLPTDPPSAIGFVAEWPGFSLIGTSFRDVLDRLDAAMDAWASYELSAGREVPPPHTPVVPPTRSSARRSEPPG